MAGAGRCVLERRRPTRSMAWAHYPFLDSVPLPAFAVGAESIELALVCQGSGSERKNCERTFLRKHASPLRSHLRNNGPNLRQNLASFLGKDCATK